MENNKKSFFPKRIELRNIKNIIAIASGKGGVGKSTVAANLALALSKRDKKVGLIDADIYGPTIPSLFGVSGSLLVEGNKIKPIVKDNIKIISMGFLVEEKDAVIWRGPLISGAIKQFITDVDWGELDFLVVDLPPGTGDASLTIAQLLPVTWVLIVTTPQKVAARVALKAATMFQKLNIPVLGIVENMSYFKCPACGKETEIFARGGTEELKEKLNLDILVKLPFSKEFMEREEKGEIKNIDDIENIFNNLALKVENKSRR